MWRHYVFFSLFFCIASASGALCFWWRNGIGEADRNEEKKGCSLEWFWMFFRLFCFFAVL
jgi:hypothetical protein